MKTILVLNADGTPINMASFKKGFLLILKGKAQVLAYEDTTPANSEKESFKRPIVIQLNKYIVMPYKKLNLSKTNIFRRDNYTCVYCGSKTNLTLDHITPKSFGGKNTWENLVTACFPCNHRKGARTPEQANMRMVGKPIMPSYSAFLNAKQMAMLNITRN